MRRTPLPALLAVPVLLAAAGLAAANPPRQCTGGQCPCIYLFSKLHQHGPLFNYGPYYGYPPFEPYGPWNAYLQYNPWYYGAPGDGGHGRDRDRGGLGDHLKGLFGKHGCGLADRTHACWKDGGWFKGSCGLHGCGKKGHHAAPAADGCSPCADPVTRCGGVGDPSQAAVFYAGLPALTPPAAAR
ncbi:MAG: hypothetical protein C0501_27525 [Isosphaera sp.]|nr:hypothetical protein [Isosphaera sp.]